MVLNFKFNKSLIPLLIPCFLFAIWGIASCFLIGEDSFYIPSLYKVLAVVFNFFLYENLVDLWFTLYRTIAGFFIAAFLGIPTGIIIGLNKKLYSSLEILIDFFRSLPATALFPLFLLFFGIGDLPKIAMTVFICFWIIQINAIYGVWNIHHLMIKMGMIYKASRFQLLKYIIIPASLPQIATGLRVAISLSLVVVVVSEMFIGTKYGLGQKIYDSYITYKIADLYAYTLIVGLLGFFLNKTFYFFETKIIHWTGK